MLHAASQIQDSRDLPFPLVIIPFKYRYWDARCAGVKQRRTIKLRQSSLEPVPEILQIVVLENKSAAADVCLISPALMLVVGMPAPGDIPISGFRFVPGSR
jgi:hypothetical protein